jgi:hypothetical protein
MCHCVYVRAQILYSLKKTMIESTAHFILNTISYMLCALVVEEWISLES